MADTVMELTDAPSFNPLALAKIDTPDQYVLVAEHIKLVSAYEKKVEAFFRGSPEKAGPLTLAYKTYKDLLEKEKAAYAPAEADRALCDRLLLDYDAEQTRIAAERQREEETRLQKEAETRQVTEAAAIEMMAEGATVEEAEAFRAEAESILEMPVQADPVHVAKETPKVAGIALRDNWKMNRAVWNQARDLKLLAAAYLGITDVKAVAKLKVNPSLVNFLTPNWTALDQQGKATKGTAKIPGVTFFNDRGVASRAK